LAGYIEINKTKNRYMMKTFTKLTNFKHLVINALSLGAFMVIGVGVSVAQMSGAYTINKAVVTGGTNFASFADAASALSTNKVNGAVTINVVANSGPYTVSSSVVFKNANATSTNSITINGNGETIERTSTGSSNSEIIRFNDADYYTLNNLVIVNKGSSYARGIRFKNGTDYLTVKNCEVNFPNLTGTSSSNSYISGVNSTSSNTASGNAGTYATIQDNHCHGRQGRGPYYGISVMSISSGNSVDGHVIDGNEVEDWYRYGIRLGYGNACKITNNEIHNNGHTSSGTMYGIEDYCYRDGGDNAIDNNEIYDMSSSTSTSTHYGIHWNGYYTDATAGDMSISGNEITMKGRRGTTYGMRVYGYRSTFGGSGEINDNVIDIEYTNTTSYTIAGIYNWGPYYAQSGWKKFDVMRNNVKVVSNRGWTYGIYDYRYFAGFDEPSYIANNVVNVQSSYYQYGIYSYAYYASNKTHMVYNTVHMSDYNGTNNGGNKYAMQPYYLPGDVQNNIIYMDNGTSGTKYGIYGWDLGTAPNFDHNVINLENASGTTQTAYWNGTDHSSMDDWQSNGQGGSNSMDNDPSFVDAANGDYTPGSFDLVNQGTPFTGVTDDINMATRNVSTPDVGAIEFFVDVEITAFSLVGSNECGNYTEEIKLTMKNNTGRDVSNVPVAFSINGKEIASEMITSNIAKNGGTVNYTFNKIARFNTPGVNTVKVYLDGSDDVPLGNEATDDLSITSSPFGSEFSENTNSKGIIKKTGFDVTIPGESIIYDVNAPDKYNNSGYSSDWTATVTAKTDAGNAVTTVGWSAPGGGADGMITFDPDLGYTDSFVNICLVVADVNTGCDTTICKRVFIAPTGVPDFDIPAQICDGDAVAFDNKSTVSTGALTYVWDFGYTGNDGSIFTHPVHTFPTSGAYQVKLTVKTDPYGYETSITKTVNVVAVPTVDFIRTNACEGTAIDLKNTTTGGTNYNWNFGDPNLPDVQTKDASALYGAPGGYAVTLTAESAGCESSITKNVYQFATPVAGMALKSGECDNDEFEFENTSTIADGSMGFLWDFNDNGNISTDVEPNYDFVNAGQHTVKLLTKSEFGCEDSTSMTVTVKEAPTATFTFDAACSETVTTFTNNSNIPTGWNPTYTWNFGDGSPVDNNMSPTHAWTELGPKTVSLNVDLDNGCSDMIEVDMSVLVQPIPEFNANDVCSGEPAVFENLTTWPQGKIKFTWDFAGLGTSNDAAPVFDFPKTTTTTYIVTLQAEIEGGCNSTVSHPITVSEGPQSCDIYAEGNHAASHRGYSFQPSTDGTSADPEVDVVYTWVVEGHGIYTGPKAEVNFVEEGEFDVTMTAKNTNTGCECSSTYSHNNVGIGDVDLESNIEVYPNPASSNITIEINADNASDMSITIVNAVGSSVMDVNTDNMVDGIVTVNVTDFPSGLYLVKITSGNTTTTKKVTVVK
jgi:PKD repeat protein